MIEKMIWVTRDYVHIDRVASSWLIKRFVDKRAQFVFLPNKIQKITKD